MSASYRVLDNMLLNLTGYLYRRDDFALAGQLGDNDLVSWLRLNLQLRF